MQPQKQQQQSACQTVDWIESNHACARKITDQRVTVKLVRVIRQDKAHFERLQAYSDYMIENRERGNR